MDTATPHDKGRTFRFVAKFLVVFATLQYGFGLCRGTAAERLIVDVATVRPSATIIDLLTPNERARAVGYHLVSPHARMSVLNGCEGTETMFLLLAAIVALGAPLRHSLTGAALGVALVYALNQLRIVSLYYAWRFDKDFFALLHGYLGPTIIVFAAGLFFLAWADKGVRTNAL